MGWIKNMMSFFKQTANDEKYTHCLNCYEMDSEIKEWIEDKDFEALRGKNISRFFDLEIDDLKQIRNMVIFALAKKYAELEYYPTGMSYKMQSTRVFLREIAAYKLIINVINRKLEEKK